MTKIYSIINIYAHGTVRQILAQNWVEWKSMLPATLFALYATALFLLGMWVWRAGIVQRLHEYRPILKKVCAWCVGIGLVVNVYVATVNALRVHGQFSLWAWSAQVVWLLGSHILSAGYISGLVLMYLHEEKRRWLKPFAAVGRMALTDYLMQSVVCTLFFYHYTTGLYGRIGPAMALIPTVVLFAAQVGFSNWWLQHYRFGPMEWLWRGMTYGKFPSMTKDELAPVLTVPAFVTEPMSIATVGGEGSKPDTSA